MEPLVSEQGADQQILVQDGAVRITLDRNVYPLDAIYGASYVFIDHSFVLLDVVDSARLRVELRGREELTSVQLQQLAGAFTNELLTQVWRQRVVEQNRDLIAAATGRAMSGALGPSGLDDIDLEAMRALEDGNEFDDPLGIAIPWEEKYGAAQADAESKTKVNQETKE